jgi:hypothetical protein
METEAPIEIKNVGELKGYTPDQLISVPRKYDPFEKQQPSTVIEEGEKFNVSERVIFKDRSGKEYDVNFRGYNGDNKAVIVGKSGSGIDQMEVDVAQLSKKQEAVKQSEKVPKPKKEGVMAKARGIEDLTDPQDLVMQHFSGGGKISSSAIQELFGGKDERIRIGSSVEGERRSRIGLLGKEGKSINDLAHELWENDPSGKFTTQDYKDAIEQVLQSHNSSGSMAKTLVDKYVNKAVKQELSEAEAKEVDDIMIQKRAEAVENLPEEQQQELVQLLEKYQDKHGFINWAKLEEDSDGFTPEILSLSTETQKSLDVIIQKNISEGQGKSDDLVDKDGTRGKEKAKEKVVSVLERKPEEVTIDDILKELNEPESEALAFKDVSNKDIGGGDVKNIEAYNQRAERVLNAIYPNAKFTALNTTEEYQKATGRSGEAGVLIRGKEGSHQLFLNLEAIGKNQIERTATHEVIHALVSDAIGAKYSDLRKQWDSLMPKLFKVKGFEIVKEHLENYSNADRPVEGITDLLANIVHNKIKIEDVPKNLWDEFIDLINKALEAIGLDYRVTPDTFNGFAKSIKEAFDTGDFKNLQNFVAKGKTEKFFKQYPQYAEQALAMADPSKRKQLQDLLEKKVNEELMAGRLSGEDAKKILGQAGIKVGEPPTEPPKTGEATEGGEGSGITHAQTAETRTKFGFEEYEKKPETFEQWDKEAAERIAKGEMPKLIKKMQGGNTPNEVEQRMMGKYIAELGRKAEENQSDENLNKLHEAIVLSDIIGGREVGKSLVSRKGTFLPDDSLAAFFEAERMANKDAPLTEKQKETVKKEWQDLEKAKNEYNAYVFEKESELSAREAQVRVAAESNTSSTRKKGTKKTDKDFADERKQIITDIKEKLRKARGETQATILPYAKELIAISPDVAKLVRNLVDNGITKLAEVVDRVHEILKEEIKDISKQDVVDLIAGNYNEKKKTRNQLARDLYELRTEAQLINKLDAILKGEAPVSEKKKVQRNQQIESLRKQIKSLTADQTALAATKSRLNSEIQKVEDKIKRGDYSKPEKKPVIKLDKEGNALRDKLIKLQQQRDARMLLQQRQNEGSKEKALRYVAEVFNIPRTLMTIGDFSGLLRQNLFFSVGHPAMTAKALPGMFKSFTSQKIYDRWFADLKETPRYDIIQKSRLAISDSLNHDLSKREEDFMSTLAEKIPIIGRDLRIGKGKLPGLNIVKGSERSYTMLLNKMRVDMFNYFADKMEARGMTVENSPKEYKAMAEYINNATGRSDFGENLNRIAPILNSVFFSPRLIASRVNMLTYWAQPRFWKTLPKEARIDYARNWASLLAVGGTIMALASLAGADVEDDPRSSDFGKIKSGDTRWDIWGGAQPYVRVVAQVATGKRRSANRGKLYDLDVDDIFGENRMGVITDFFRNKLAPVPGSAVDILSGRTGIGEKIVYQWGGEEDREISISNYVKERMLPMTITGTQEAIREDGLERLFTVGIPSTFGVGTQAYKSTPPKGNFKIYQNSGDKVREATDQEVEKVEQDKEKIYEQELKKAELNKGWGFNKYGELTTDDDAIKKKGDYKNLSDEDKKELQSRLKSSANTQAKKKIKY